jgi:hypothetical protein
MTLREVAHIAGATPKRVINTLNAVGSRSPYSYKLALRLCVTLAVHDATGIPLRRAFAIAAQALRAHADGEAAVAVGGDRDHVAIVIDMQRLLSSCAIRMSALRTLLGGRVRGRPRVRRTEPLKAATDWGLDLSLLRENLRRTPEERLRQLDGMAAFARNVHRTSSTRD